MQDYWTGLGNDVLNQFNRSSDYNTMTSYEKGQWNSKKDLADMTPLNFLNDNINSGKVFDKWSECYDKKLKE